MCSGQRRDGRAVRPVRQLTLLLAALAYWTVGYPASALPPPPKEYTDAAGEITFELDSGNVIHYVAATAVPLIYSDVSPTAGDAPVVLHFTTSLLTAWFDATAPYHPTAVGNYSRLGRVPESETTTRNVNTAVLHASFHSLSSLLPARAQVFRNMLLGAGLDPDDESMDLSTAVGIGNAAGRAAVTGRVNDGMNQLGNEPAPRFNALPYSDYTGYKPVNTAFRLINPSRWQPDIQVQGTGLYKIQQFVTPQYSLVEPYSYDSPENYSVPSPAASNHLNVRAYRDQAKNVLQVSATLTDEQKMQAELFDDKLRSLGLSSNFAGTARQLSTIEVIHLDFLQIMAAFDAGIFVWQEKRQHDAVRPFSAIRHAFGSNLVVARAGSGPGTTLVPASEWKSYLEEADHPEYPSASACFCEAHAQAGRRFLGTDELGLTIEFAAGTSRIEPGSTPSHAIAVEFPTWTAFSEACGQSRVWAGVHFQAAVDESQNICGMFGDLAYAHVMSLVDGTAAPRAPSRGR